MKLRKFITLFVPALLLVSCGSGTNTDGGDQGGYDSDAPVTNQNLKIMFHVDAKSAEGQAYKKRIDAFNTEYKDAGIKVTATYKARTTGAGSYETELTNMQLEGSLPDIITFDAPNCASYAASDLLVDITSYFSEEEQNDFLTINKYNGNVYGLPIQESSAGFYYNKKIFKEANIDVSQYTADNPWTFDEFKDACSKLKSSGKVSYSVDMRLDATRDETATYMLYPFIYATGGDYVSEDGFTATGHFNSANTKKGFDFLKSLVTDGYTSYSIGSTDFFDGKVGMYLSSGWTIPDLDNKYPTTFPDRDSWGLLPYPKEAAEASATGSWCFGVTNNGKSDKRAAIMLLKYLTSAESSKTITDATGMVPARKSVTTSYADTDPEKVLIDQLARNGKPRPATVGYPKFSECFRQVISEMKDGDVQEILDSKTRILQSELDKLNK